MRHLLFTLTLAAGVSFCPSLNAQVDCSKSTKLICLIPSQLDLLDPAKSSNFGVASFPINEAVGSEVSSLPLASPASGIIYIFDPKLNVPVPTSETLGPVLTQRPETIGRHRIYIAVTYQGFRFEDLDGVSLRTLPVVVTLPDGLFSTATNNRLDLTASQVTGYLTFGLTSRVDISAAVPVLHVEEQLTTSGLRYDLTNTNNPPSAINDLVSTGASTGIGDVILAVKGTVWKPSRGGLAVGAEVRLPTGDSLNFLGAGTIGVKPYVSMSYGRRLAIHGTVGYQINGNSDLVSNGEGTNGHLPNRLYFSEGVEWGATQWITLAADLISERVFNAERIEATSTLIQPRNVTFPDLSSYGGSYNRSDGSAGFKVKPYHNLIITANLLVKLDQGGLRTRLLPLGGLSYTF